MTTNDYSNAEFYANFVLRTGERLNTVELIYVTTSRTRTN